MKKVIEIKNLSYTYPDGKLALQDISLDIFEGESVGIIGPNGAGKTTLLLHLNGILKSKNGKIKIFGKELNNGNLRTIRSKVGLLFQDPEDQLFMPTVFDDVSFGPLNLGFSKDIVIQKVKNALEQVKMAGFEERSPHHLSYGEKKRVALATILAMEPEILLLDEPTGNLDPATRREFIELLKNFNHTKIVAGHDLEFIKEISTRVILLNQGRIIKDALPSEIFSDQKILFENRLV